MTDEILWSVNGFYYVIVVIHTVTMLSDHYVIAFINATSHNNLSLLTEFAFRLQYRSIYVWFSFLSSTFFYSPLIPLSFDQHRPCYFHSNIYKMNKCGKGGGRQYRNWRILATNNTQSLTINNLINVIDVFNNKCHWIVLISFDRRYCLLLHEY